MQGHDLFKLHKLHSLVGCPPYAKTASEQGETKPCPPLAYGDLDGRLYPCHTKEAAFNSCILAADAGVTSEVEANLKKLASFWGISNDVSAAWTKIASAKSKIASSDELGDDEYALVQEHGGKKIRKFAAFDLESTVSAAEAFYNKRHQYPFPWRKEASARLLGMAAQHSAILPAYIQTYLLKAACVARPTTDSVDEGLVQRMNLAHGREDDVMDKVASLLNKVASAPEDFDGETVGEILALVDEADREVKLAQHYESGRISLPEEMLVVPPRVKVAAAPIQLINGRSVEPSLLTKEALAAVDEELATMSFGKLAEVLPTLPRPEADLLSRLVTTTKTAAVAPKGTEAASMGMNQSPSAPDFAKAMSAKPGATVPSAGKAPIGQPFSPARSPVAKTGAVAEALARSEARLNKIAVNGVDLNAGAGSNGVIENPGTRIADSSDNAAARASNPGARNIAQQTPVGPTQAEANDAFADAHLRPGELPSTQIEHINDPTSNSGGMRTPSSMGSSAGIPAGITQPPKAGEAAPAAAPAPAPIPAPAPVTTAANNGPNSTGLAGTPMMNAPTPTPAPSPLANAKTTPGNFKVNATPTPIPPITPIKTGAEVPMGGSVAPAGGGMGDSLTDDNFASQTAPGALAAPAAPAMPAAPAAPMAPGMTPHNGIQVASGGVSAGMVGQAPMTPNQQFDFDKSNQAAAAQNGLATTHAPLR